MNESYMEAMHRMQSAVAFDIAKSIGEEITPERLRYHLKDLRTGLNSALGSDGGLAELLIEKGVFTAEEYIEAVRLAAIKEADRTESEVRKKHNLPPSVRFR